MSKVFAFLADGLEEVDCLAVVDVLRRAGAEVTLVSVTGSREITGSHHIHFQADALFDETAAEDADVLFLPGGMPGTNTLKAHEGLKLSLIHIAYEIQHLGKSIQNMARQIKRLMDDIVACLLYTSSCV